eukprot:108188-Prorocentrum_lima.AAC.1
MTSSLVGSEMCIRDRYATLADANPFVVVAHAERVKDVHISESGRTVSYTHLTLPTICSV